MAADEKCSDTPANKTLNCNGLDLSVGTAGVAEFEYVRKFYAKHGFEEEARIRDFYESGVDKVVFRKLLT